MRLVCGDQTIDVEVRDGEGEVEPLGPGVFLFRQGDRREIFHCVRDGETVHLFWGGRAYLLEEETERSRSAHRHVGGGLEAPMPGKVIAVNVAPGDTVMKGDELLVVEAMKMENAVRAPREGRVKSVSAQVGDMVSPGVVLVELE